MVGFTREAALYGHPRRPTVAARGCSSCGGMGGRGRWMQRGTGGLCWVPDVVGRDPHLRVLPRKKMAEYVTVDSMKY